MTDPFTIRQEVRRKLIHMSTAVVGLCMLWVEPGIMRWITLTMAILFPLLDLGRRKIAFFARIYASLFKSVTRPFEEKHITSAAIMFVSMAITVWLFSPTIAAAALLFTSVGDAAAAIVGRSLGQTRIGKKTLEGTLAFLSCTICIALLIPNLAARIGILGAVGAGLVELIPIPHVDDNLSVPILSALIMTISGGIL